MKLLLFFLKVYYNTIGLIFPNHSVKKLAHLFSTPRKTVFRSKEIEIINQAQSSFIQSGELEICLYEWGEGSDYALLCHGWESNAGSLGAMVTPLLEKGLKVIAFDGPAHGKSGGKQASLLKFKDVILTLFELKGTPKIAIGHSLGAMAIMLATSERHTPIEKTVLFAPINQVTKVFIEFKELIDLPDKLYGRFITHLEQQSGYLLGKLVFEDIAPKTSLEKVLVLHDEQDKITSIKHSEAISKNWINAKLIRINGSGHYKILWHEHALKEVKLFIS